MKRLPEKVGERKRTNRLTPRGRGAEPFHVVPRRNAVSRCRSRSRTGLERQAGSPAIMPPPPVTPKPGAGGFVHGPIVTTHSRKVRRRQKPTSACTNQLRRHWRPLTAIRPKASQARLTSGRAGPATGNSEPTSGACQGCPQDNIATTKPQGLRPNSQVHRRTSETG